MTCWSPPNLSLKHINFNTSLWFEKFPHMKNIPQPPKKNFLVSLSTIKFSFHSAIKFKAISSNSKWRSECNKYFCRLAYRFYFCCCKNSEMTSNAHHFAMKYSNPVTFICVSRKRIVSHKNPHLLVELMNLKYFL